MEAYFDAMFETYDLLQNVMLTRVYFCFQDGSEKSDSKLLHGVTATFVRFVRELIGRADGFVLCIATPLRELTCHTGSHSVTCHAAELTFPPLLQPKLVLD